MLGHAIVSPPCSQRVKGVVKRPEILEPEYGIHRQTDSAPITFNHLILSRPVRMLCGRGAAYSRSSQAGNLHDLQKSRNQKNQYHPVQAQGSSL